MPKIMLYYLYGIIHKSLIMIKLKEGDYVKVATESKDNFVYKIMKFYNNIPRNQALIKRLSDGYTRKVKLVKLYSVNKDGEIYELPLDKGEVKMSSKRNRNPNNIRKGDKVKFITSGSNNKAYDVIEANSSTCWVRDPKNHQEVKKGVHYYKLKLINDTKIIEDYDPKNLYIENSNIHSFSAFNINPQQKTGEIILNLSDGSKQTIQLYDNIELVSVDYSRTVKSTIKV